ncbi:hypothetical protein LIP_1457 [Limnochorda pilosa]|uniref:Uncharacterized protein n=1 Tax=Limnochorda pilosa TaxID=1555112 RepID=A0A0K2SJL7_LIMPI|nr:hypothetical protein LIP_1457 [Limnochorda pilosa]
MGITSSPVASSGASPVHPHARGDHAASRMEPLCAVGSPPRAWGSHRLHQGGLREHRFTPTRVGITTKADEKFSLPSVHPHARGDHTVGHGGGSRVRGSPPRAWGSRDQVGRDHHSLRFTPTRVGITPPPPLFLAPPPVHPHARGDHRRRLQRLAFGVGSPPRAWGSLSPILLSSFSVRFTPTRVGITLCCATRQFRPAVHPHARGDHKWRLAPWIIAHGSPPRAWGSRAGAAPPLPGLRFTPTRVGITRVTSSSGVTGAVHPHARGDHDSPVAQATVRLGSPPRAWGSHRSEMPDADIPRFTPTRVGITIMPQALAMAVAVHPHARGDHSL